MTCKDGIKEVLKLQKKAITLEYLVSEMNQKGYQCSETSVLRVLTKMVRKGIVERFEQPVASTPDVERIVFLYKLSDDKGKTDKSGKTSGHKCKLSYLKGLVFKSKK